MSGIKHFNKEYPATKTVEIDQEGVTLTVEGEDKDHFNEDGFNSDSDEEKIDQVKDGANCFLLVFAVSGPFTSRLAVCICFSWFSRSEVCAFVWGIFVRGLRVETFVRVLRSSRCRL